MMRNRANIENNASGAATEIEEEDEMGTDIFFLRGWFEKKIEHTADVSTINVPKAVQ